MQIHKYIPNTFTALNLIAGCIGLIAVYEGNLFQGAMFILIGAAFDFLDGFSARLLNTISDIGKQLDSLADMVTFGLLPAFLMYFLLEDHEIRYISLISLLIAISSAFRLAKFNVDPSQGVLFKGLPTPADAFLIAGLVFAKEADWEIFSFIYGNITGLIFITMIVSILLNAPLSFLSFKITQFKFKGNEYIFILMTASVICIFFFGFQGILPATLFYVLLSLLQNITKANPVS
jgi:CDP-diacylglycerol--serine O-phosphatidyltransferase